MKKIILGLSLFLFATGMYAQNVLIKGHIRNLDGYVKIIRFNGEKNAASDSVLLNSANPDFMMKIDAETPEIAYLEIGKNKAMPFFLAPDEMYLISGDNATPKKITIKGSSAQNSYYELQKRLSVFDNEMAELDEEHDRLTKANKKDEAKTLEQKYDEIYERREAEQEKFVKENTDNLAGLYILVRGGVQYSLPLETLEGLTTDFQKHFPGNQTVQKLAERVDVLKTVAIGQVAPDFEAPNPAGEMIKFSAFAKGKYVVLEFWASWCGYCRRENPNFLKVYNKYKPYGFDMISVSLDKTKDAWIKGIKDDKLPWMQVSELKFWQGEISQKYGVASIPTCWLIGTDGTIIARDLKGDALDAKLAEIYKVKK